MKFGVVINPHNNNYGDDIQTIAAARLLPRVDYYLDRENLNIRQTDDEIKMITNGWFMYKPYNWPPADNIRPLFISFHATHLNNTIGELFDKRHFEYYKKYEPIGCRDYHTLNLFKSIGIDAYYSGCLTLTLENKFTESDRTEEILLVDPLYSGIPNDMKEKILEKIIPDSIKDKTININHNHKLMTDNEKRLKIVEGLIDRYSKAHLVVTSRIHVALPCLALGTPVLFLDLGFNTIDERNRFSGVVDYLNTVNSRQFPFTRNDFLSKIYKKLKLYNLFCGLDKIDFDWDNPPKSSTDNYLKYAESIRKTVNDFIKE